MIAELIRILRQTNPDVTPRDVADVLWLAAQIKVPHSTDSLETGPIQETPRESFGSSAKPSDAASTTAEEINDNAQRRQTMISLHRRSSSKEGEEPNGAGVAVRSPSAPAIPMARNISKALRPLRHRVSSKTRFALDEISTAEFVAEARMGNVRMLGVKVRPELERWLDLGLVIDESASMSMWRTTVSEAKAILSGDGAFRDVKVYRIKSDDVCNVELYVGSSRAALRRCNPGELINPLGRRLVIVVSDCIGSAWDDGRMARFLGRVMTHGPVAILQILPERLWLRTGLEAGTRVRINSSEPGAPNSRYRVERITYGLKSIAIEGVPLPVISVDPRSVQSLAELIAGIHRTWVKGYVLAAAPSTGGDTASSFSFASPVERVLRFRSTATPTARRLAALLAVTPTLSLPVIRIVREAMLPDASQAHLAEVILGGILYEIIGSDLDADPDATTYDFYDGVRELLIDSTSVSDAIEVLRRVSHYVSSNIGHPRDFRAVATGSSISGETRISVDEKPFARVHSMILRRLDRPHDAPGDDFQNDSPELSRSIPQATGDAGASGEPAVAAGGKHDARSNDVPGEHPGAQVIIDSSASPSEQLGTGPERAGVVLRDGYANILHDVGADGSAATNKDRAKENGERTGRHGRIDVLILTSMYAEYDAVLSIDGDDRRAWLAAKAFGGFRYHFRTLRGERGELVLAIFCVDYMVNRVRADVAATVQAIIGELDPACLAICGVCSGRRSDVSLGDVIVVDRIYDFKDRGPGVSKVGEQVLHGVEMYSLETSWGRDLAFLAMEIAADMAALGRERPLSIVSQRRWALDAFDKYERRDGPAPHEHPDLRVRCPRWRDVVSALERDGLIELDKEGSMYRLTEWGRQWIPRDPVRSPGGLDEAPPFRVHVGAIATGGALLRTPQLFDRTLQLNRHVIGFDMDAVGVVGAAARAGRRATIVKAVSDYGGPEKDDSFLTFACRASAKVLLTLLQRQLVPRPQSVGVQREEREDYELPRRHEPRNERPRSEFTVRVERVCRVREGEGATVIELEPRPPLSGLLEVSLSRDGSDWRFPLGVLDRPLDEAAVTVFGDILDRYRAENPYAPGRLIHVGDPASPALLARARARGIELIPFSEYQRLVDLTRYAERQLARIDADDRYPAALYVEQRAKHRLGRGPWEPAEDVLQQILSVLDSEHGRLLLVLGDFGTGKTFLMRELCRRLTASGDRKPVLVEMRALEKRRTLNELLAQHFAAAAMGKIDLEGFRYLLAEGRVVLLFDGFDELAFRVSYDRVLEHFVTVLEAASDRAKVVVTSRTGHFLTDQDVNKELANRAEQTGHARLFKLEPFQPDQIRRFLVKLLGDEAAAAARFNLLREVEDLLGFSANPRMLSFIAEIEEEELKATRERAGRITSAALYELLLRRWLRGEVKLAADTAEEPALGEAQLWKAVTDLALMLWPKVEQEVSIEEIPRDLIAAAQALDPRRKPAEEGLVRHQLGSRSLLVRDEGGRFSFLHQSVMEWLVADAAARAVKEGGDAPVLGQREMSDLMADFFIARAGREAARRWASGKRGAEAEEASLRNAQRVERRLRAGGEEEGGQGRG